MATSATRKATQVVAVARIARPKPRRGRNRAGGATRVLGSAAPIATGMSVVGRTTDSAVLSGVDRLASIANIKDLAAGAQAINELIVPGAFQRLRHVARSFQKIRYNYLRFRIEPQTSTATSGGYVAAFIRDPADVVPGKKDLLPYLTAQRGSVTTKWWQSSVVNPGPFPATYFTSESVEVREYSPGRLVLAVDGAATQAGNLTVFCEWSVTCSVASLETDKTVTPVATVLQDLYIRTSLTELYGKLPGDKWISTPSALISGAEVGKSYRLPAPVAVQEAAETVRSCWFIKVLTASTMKLGREKPGDSISANLSESMVLPRGLVLDEIDASPAGFQQPASESILNPNCDSGLSNAPSVSVNDSPKLMNDLISSLQQLTGLVSGLHHRLENSQLRELRRSTEFRRKSEGSWSLSISDLPTACDAPIVD